jgi:hypothetical protein
MAESMKELMQLTGMPTQAELESEHEYSQPRRYSKPRNVAYTSASNDRVSTLGEHFPNDRRYKRLAKAN